MHRQSIDRYISFTKRNKKGHKFILSNERKNRKKEADSLQWEHKKIIVAIGNVNSMKVKIIWEYVGNLSKGSTYP